MAAETEDTENGTKQVAIILIQHSIVRLPEKIKLP
jgi:hypothetical protein